MWPVEEPVGAQVGDGAAQRRRSGVNRCQLSGPGLVKEGGRDPSLAAAEPGSHTGDGTAQYLRVADQGARAPPARARVGRPGAQRKERPDRGEFRQRNSRVAAAHGSAGRRPAKPCWLPWTTETTRPAGTVGTAWGCRIEAIASTPSARRGPGRTTMPSASMAQTGNPGMAAATA